MAIQLYYPMQGSRKFGTSSSPITKSFRVDYTACSVSNIKTCAQFPKGSLVLGFLCKVVTAFTSTGSAVLSAGLAADSANKTSSVIAVASLVESYVFGLSSTATAVPFVLSAGTAFTLHNNTVHMSAGVMDVHVTYVPPPDGVVPEGDAFATYDVT